MIITVSIQYKSDTSYDDRDVVARILTELWYESDFWECSDTYIAYKDGTDFSVQCNIIKQRLAEYSHVFEKIDMFLVEESASITFNGIPSD